MRLQTRKKNKNNKKCVWPGVGDGVDEGGEYRDEQQRQTAYRAQPLHHIQLAAAGGGGLGYRAKVGRYPGRAAR